MTSFWRHPFRGAAILSHARISWSGRPSFRPSCAQLSAVARQPLVLKTLEFQHLFEEGPTERAYAGTPMGDLSQPEQGKMMQEWARRVLEGQNPGIDVSVPGEETCCNGSRRGPNRSSYDFRLGRQRVEVKSARLAWDATRSRWYALFADVKLGLSNQRPAFDDLYLALIFPKGLHLIKHDLITGVTRDGKSTEVFGHRVQASGSAGTRCCEQALREILEKLCECGGCTVVFQELFSQEGLINSLLSERAGKSPGQAALAGIPMFNMSFQRRGKLIEKIGLAIDQKTNPGYNFSLVESNLDSSGQKRSAANATADWVRGTTRVELKSGSLCFDKAHGRWQCLFRRIKPELFDELWLAIYSPIGIHFYRSESIQALGLASCGAATAHAGFQKSFTAPRGEGDPLKALKAIEAKMISKGCQLVAVVEWEKGRCTALRPFGRGKTVLKVRLVVLS